MKKGSRKIFDFVGKIKPAQRGIRAGFGEG